MTEAAGLGVGSALAEARKALGLSHHDVAQQLKFMPRQLEALEAERFDSLPGPTIARGMVRTYARFLKLEPEPLLERMAGRVEAPDPTPQLSARFNQPVPFSDGGRRSTLLYLVLSAGVLALAGGLLYEWRHERPVAQFVSPAKEQPVQVAKVETVAKKVEATVKKAEPVAKPEAKSEAKPETKPEAKPAAPVVVASAPKAVAGPNRLRLQFEEEAWLEVTNGAGKLLISSLQPGGTERVVNCAPPCSLVVGNASSVRITYNDREVDLQAHARADVARFTLP
ncbi:MAG TPA: RodZ domain-containing protein [Burkholderiales bacterium]|nr:RodZ domain-containing protein [Burkholderiales bacterium]